MANYLKMPKKQQVLALLALGWSYRRIQGETGVRRETVSEYDKQRQANPAKRSPAPRPIRGAIRSSVTATRWQIGHCVPRVEPKSGQNVRRLGLTLSVLGRVPVRRHFICQPGSATVPADPPS